MSELCQQCGAKCCRYFCFEIDKPESYEEFENIRWYLCHQGVSVHVDEGDWYISIENICNNLNGDNQCKDYANRPLICRRYSSGGCDYTQGAYGYEQLFTRPEQLEAYARKTLGAKAFDKARDSARAELEPVKVVGFVPAGAKKGASGPRSKGKVEVKGAAGKRAR